MDKTTGKSVPRLNVNDMNSGYNKEKKKFANIPEGIAGISTVAGGVTSSSIGAGLTTSIVTYFSATGVSATIIGGGVVVGAGVVCGLVGYFGCSGCLKLWNSWRS